MLARHVRRLTRRGRIAFLRLACTGGYASACRRSQRACRAGRGMSRPSDRKIELDPRWPGRRRRGLTKKSPYGVWGALVSRGRGDGQCQITVRSRAENGQERALRDHTACDEQRCRESSSSSAAREGKRNGEVEGAASAELALGPDSPAVRVHDAPGNVKAESKPSAIIFAHLPEALEYRLQHIHGYTLTGIEYRYTKFSLQRARPELSRRPRGR